MTQNRISKPVVETTVFKVRESLSRKTTTSYWMIDTLDWHPPTLNLAKRFWSPKIGFPTIKYFPGSPVALDFREERKAKPMVDFALKNMPVFAKKIKSAVDLNEKVSKSTKVCLHSPYPAFFLIILSICFVLFLSCWDDDDTKERMMSLGPTIGRPLHHGNGHHSNLQSAFECVLQTDGCLYGHPKDVSPHPLPAKKRLYLRLAVWVPFVRRVMLSSLRNLDLLESVTRQLRSCME